MLWLSYKIRSWIPLAVAITGVCLLVYVVGQQILRQGANDPQIQISEDAAARLASGAGVMSIVPPATIDISKTLSPFIMVYNAQGNLDGSTAVLNGKNPVVPQGVLNFAKAKGQNRLTWQPAFSVRDAIVVTYFKDKNEGYVLVGRSLLEVERREELVLHLAAAAWFVMMVATLLAALVFVPVTRKK